MTRQEAIKILSILKAAYPNSYRGMTKEEANGTINIWAMQFVKIPYSVVSIAIHKLISKNTFPPSISEVKSQIRNLYWEAWQALESHERATVGIRFTDDPDEEPLLNGQKLDDKSLALVKELLEICSELRTQDACESTLYELLSGYETYLDGTKQIEGE